MRVTLDSTDAITQLRVKGVDVPARLWIGETASGQPVHAWIPTIALAKHDATAADEAEFARDLVRTPRTVVDTMAIPLRLIL